MKIINGQASTARIFLGFICLCVLAPIAVYVWAENPNYAVGGDKNALRLGKNLNGTRINFLAAGTVTILSGNTSSAAAVTGISAGDIVLVTINEDLGSATYAYGVPSTNSVNVAVDQDPGTDLTASYLVIGVP